VLDASQESAVNPLFHCEQNPPLAFCRFVSIEAEDWRPVYWPPFDALQLGQEP